MNDDISVSVSSGAKHTNDLFLDAVRVLQLTGLPPTNSAPLRLPGRSAQIQLGTSVIVTLEEATEKAGNYRKVAMNFTIFSF